MADISTLMGQLSGMDADSNVEFEGSIALFGARDNQRRPVVVYKNKKFAVTKSLRLIVMTEVPEDENAFQIIFSPGGEWTVHEMAHDEYICIPISEVNGISPDYIKENVMDKFVIYELRII